MCSSSGGQLYEYNFWYNHSVLVAVRYAGQDGTSRWITDNYQFHIRGRRKISFLHDRLVFKEHKYHALIMSNLVGTKKGYNKLHSRLSIT
jgi:hypothetical protein